jgi:dTDP-4-amino-4,6-dideoxygalactose transaminase
MNQDTRYKLQDIINLDILELLKDYGVGWNNPYDIIYEFEKRLAEYTGAPYVVTTDCCTHALELALRWYKKRHPSHVPSIKIPDQTYLSIPMMLEKVGLSFSITEEEWIGEYQLGPNLPIWDSARRLQKNMYEEETFKCLSFGHGKPLTIGKGGAILLDSREAYDWLIRARYDGRDLKVSPWDKEHYETLGFHYYMSPDQAAIGIVKLDQYKETAPKKVAYPSIKKCFMIGNNK